MVAKRLGLLHELVPGMARVAVLVNPANAINSETTMRDAQAAAGAMGLQIQVINASSSREINAAFASLRANDPMPCSLVVRAFSTAGVSNWSI